MIGAVVVTDGWLRMERVAGLWQKVYEVYLHIVVKAVVEWL